MKKWTYVISVVTLVVGLMVGYESSRNQMNRSTNAQLNANLYQIWGTLYQAQVDLKQSTTNPTTREEKGYENNYKIAIAQAYSVWQAMELTLYQQGGVSLQDLQQINGGLKIIYETILPPYGMNLPSATIERARNWILVFESSLNTANPSLDFDYVKLLRSNIGNVVQKYRSYKSDGNFEVGNP